MEVDTHLIRNPNQLKDCDLHSQNMAMYVKVPCNWSVTFCSNENTIIIHSLCNILTWFSCFTALFTKLPAGGRNDLRDYSRLQGFSGIVQGKAGNDSAGSFVNSTVTALFTKLPVGILPMVGMTPVIVPTAGSIHSLWEFQELYQAKSWNGQEPWSQRLCE